MNIISEISNYILESIQSKLEQGYKDVFITENIIFSVFSISRKIKLNQVDVNTALYLINCQFKKPVIFSKMVNSQYGGFERAFYFETHNIKTIESVYNIVLSTPILFETNDKMTNEDEILCKVVMSEKDGIYLITQLKVDKTPPMLLSLENFQENRLFEANPYHFYIFNSMYSNYQNDSLVYLELDTFESFQTNNRHQIFYPDNHFNVQEIDELKTYSFN